MVKQSSSVKCICGQTITFPEGEIKTVCKTKDCGAVWDLGPEGYWYSETPVTQFVPILAMPVVHSAKSRPERYNNHPKSKRKKGRKERSRC
ncbi:MAG: hypothetical protein APF81_27420 [Desulfosporosinus sp. BRH_c37]|nr:MAG: hypothetical protein APF81_27420 [Desulfosporosinus sp. BRH_c37]